jgi:hypothetical protein
LGVIAHELNNIAVPLGGFIDLALQATATGALALQSLDEINVGLARIGALAYLLECLAQQDSMLSRTTAGACFAPGQGDFANPPQLVWSCSELTPVKADPDHALRAIISLMHLAGPGPLSVRESAMEGLVCAVCGKRMARRQVLEVRASGMRPAIFSAISAPFAASQKLRAMQRLAIAALAHCAHLAGGHVIAQPDSESLSVVLLSQR